MYRKKATFYMKSGKSSQLGHQRYNTSACPKKSKHEKPHQRAFFNVICWEGTRSTVQPFSTWPPLGKKILAFVKGLIAFQDIVRMSWVLGVHSLPYSHKYVPAEAYMYCDLSYRHSCGLYEGLQCTLHADCKEAG